MLQFDFSLVVTQAMMERMSAAIRALTIDAVSRANSGHPGMPLGMADVATVLFTKFLKFNPHDPDWPDRDRFVLSAGHGSMLLYSLLYLTGYPEYTLEEIKNFRQFHSKTPGHPEYGVAKGIENTSGPLGQGFAMGIGMALAEATLNARFGKIVDHYTYIIAGDGCLMEGISHEAASFAGHMQLRKVILLFDDNKISIDGSTSLCTSDDNLKRFESYGWDVQQINGHDFVAIENAIAKAKSSDKPSMIAASTVIGKFMPNEGTEKTHSGGLSLQDRITLKKKLNYPLEDFEIPDDVMKSWRALGSFQQYKAWQLKCKDLPSEILVAFNSALATHINSHLITGSHIKGASETSREQQNFCGISYGGQSSTTGGETPVQQGFNHDGVRTHGKMHQSGTTIPETLAHHTLGYAQILDELKTRSTEIASEATRYSSGRIIKFLTSKIPEMIGGSCDLAGSNNVIPEPFREITKENYDGNYIHYGVREHFMGACMNGMALHRGIVPYGGTFFIFSDYLRPAIRMSALMGVQVIYVMTHDSIGVGEDGPTHQPIEQLDSLNLIPNLYVFRPCDYIEVLECWQTALSLTNAPSVMVLSRQKVDFIQREPSSVNLSSRGAYVIKKASGKAKISLLASGSEVGLCAGVQTALEELGHPAELISVPCISLLRKNWDTHNAPQLVEPDSIRVAVEAGSGLMMKSVFDISLDSLFNIEEFGVSAPCDQLYDHFGLTTTAILEHCLKRLSEVSVS